jgi:predicted helicase
MLKNSINTYYNTIAKLKDVGRTKNESALSKAFASLLQDYCDLKELTLVEQALYKTTRLRPDGTIRTKFIDWGFWESKDTYDDIDTEIEKKIEIGYPTTNILFEDSQTAVLIQNREEVMRIDILNDVQLDRILCEFINCVPEEYIDFENAIKRFKEDVPAIVDSLRKMIDNQYATNNAYKMSVEDFFETCKQSINPEISMSNIREMIIQHILTADIFDKIFGDSQFHRENNIALQLQTVIDTFFTRQTKFQLLSSIGHYYDFIRSRASQIADYHEKQKFLKAVYENFYSAYNPLGADRLGIIYTPNEIVKFMIESSDFLLEKYFDKTLADENVEILDPATGTGTFICDIIEHIPPHKLENKFKNEIHANEVAILPYYIANLNIEYTYQQKMNKYEPFNNLCFVDTLDNMGFGYEGKQTTMFGGISAENLERIKIQNAKKISLIIGNPPYNANQQSENENNKNKQYKVLDDRIKNSYIKNSSSQKTKVYDMYSRFFRWASDRVNGGGIIAFITNRSFIDSKTYDGFRKTLAIEFDYIYVVDTQSDVRKNPKIAGTTHNVFGIQTGVAIMFLIRLKTKNGNGIKKFNDINVCEHKAQIFYFSLTDEMKKGEKLHWFADNKLPKIPFERIRPDDKGYWLNITDSDFDTLIPVCSKTENAIFHLHTLGVSTNRDNWVYDFDKTSLENKIKHFIENYNNLIDQYSNKKGKIDLNEFWDNSSIKWSASLKKTFLRKQKLKFSKKLFIKNLYRPFITKYYYSEKKLSDRLTQNHYNTFGKKFENENICIGIMSGAAKPFSVLLADKMFDLNYISPAAGGTTFCSMYRYDKKGSRIENITDWGLQQFQAYYKKEIITKEDIFYYVYAVLHNPNYRLKYEQELKREYPRIPLYDDFDKWTHWGRQLAEIHLNYETIEPYKLELIEIGNKDNPKPKLKLDKENSTISIDENTEIRKIPPIAMSYQLGNRSAMEWILDQYKEKEMSEPILSEKFNKYKFSDHKKYVIDLIKRVCNVSVKTMQIVDEMKLINKI